MNTKSTKTKDELMREVSFIDMIVGYKTINDISYKEVSELTGKSKQYISDIVNGRKIPSIAQAKQIAQSLGEPAELYVIGAINDQIKKEKLDIRLNIA